MGKQATAALAACAGGFLLLICLLPILVLCVTTQSGPASAAAVAATTGGSCTYTPASAGGAVAAGISLTSAQLQIAGTGVAVAKQRNLPAQASIDIIAAGYQESNLVNLTSGDLDSVGWLQQRPSQGWGTVAQIMDPTYAAGQFLDHLVTVTNWQTLPPTVAIQAVQASAYPNAYAQWVPMATALAANLLGDPSVALVCSGGGGGPPGASSSAAVSTALARAGAQLGLPYCWGGGDASGPTHAFGGAGCGGQTIGFDCSGLMIFAWAGAGVSLPHSAAMQYGYGTKIPLALAQPGDLIFKSSDGSAAGIHHVAMIWTATGDAAGTGQIIEASTYNVPVRVRAWQGVNESQVMPFVVRLTSVPGG